MDTKPLNELQHPSYNPRKISTTDFNNLINSIREFGDLSCVVRNVTSGNLVCGNQRFEALKTLGSDRIHITERMSDGPDKYGTVALGYILLPDGATISYREVLWTPEKEKAANIASNRIQGEWDKDLLAQLDYELSQLENGDELLALSGQSEDEITKLLQSVGAGPEPEEPEEEPEEPKDDGKITFALSPDQKELVEQALARAKADYAIPHTNLDNINGTALYYICSAYVQNATSQNIETPTEPQLPADQPISATPADATQLDQLPAA